MINIKNSVKLKGRSYEEEKHSCGTKGGTESSMQLMVAKKNFSVGGNLKSFFVQ